MEIPPISNYSNIPAPQDPELRKLSDLWNNWWNNPSQKTGEKLLNFLKKEKSYFEELAKGKPPPPGFPRGASFESIYKNAVNYLQGCISHGCNPDQKTPVSEWVSDIYTWASEK